MKGEKKERFPACVPLYHRLFVKSRKVMRQAMLRVAESKARRHRSNGQVSDGEAHWTEVSNGSTANSRSAINKSAVWLEEDMQLPEIHDLTGKIEDLKAILNQQGLQFTNTAARQ